MVLTVLLAFVAVLIAKQSRDFGAWMKTVPSSIYYPGGKGMK